MINDIRTGYITRSMGKRGRARKARVAARWVAEVQAEEDRYLQLMNQYHEANKAAERFWKEQEALAILRERQMSTWAKFKRWLSGK